MKDYTENEIISLNREERYNLWQQINTNYNYFGQEHPGLAKILLLIMIEIEDILNQSRGVKSVSDKNDGGFVFPFQPLLANNPLINTMFLDKMNIQPQNGMTLRDYFAAKAMQGLVVDTDNENLTRIANTAYAIADALLDAKENNNKTKENN